MGGHPEPTEETPAYMLTGLWVAGKSHPPLSSQIAVQQWGAVGTGQSCGWRWERLRVARETMAAGAPSHSPLCHGDSEL